MRKPSEIIKECIKALQGETHPFNIPVYEYAVELQEALPSVNLDNITEHSEALHTLVMVHEKKISEAHKSLSPGFPSKRNLKNKLKTLDIDALSNLIKLRLVIRLNTVTTAGLVYSLAWLRGREYASLDFPEAEKVRVEADVSNFYEEPNFMTIVRDFLNLLRQGSNKAEMFEIIRGDTWKETVRKFMAFTFLIDTQKIKVISERDKKFIVEV
ncbi:MAG: hypothetical protein ACTSP1_04755 [Candidatus Freyarchaeota archaeon]